MAIEVSFLLPDLTEEEYRTFQGETPFHTIVDNMVAQFNEFLENHQILTDTTDYIDLFKDELSISLQVQKASAFDQFDIPDDGLKEMNDTLTDIFLYCMEEIGCDLYQQDDAFKTGYYLYTNMMLADQRQSFFEYAVDRIINRMDPSSEIFVASSQMLHGIPEPMYNLLSDLDLTQEDSVYEYLVASGNDDLASLVEDGMFPEDIMFNLFLKPLSLSKSYSVYYMHKHSKE